VSEDRLRLRCPKCPRKGEAARDETDPPNAVLAYIVCPDCDDGDRHSPEYWDANNHWVDPVAHLIPKEERANDCR
jgi:hypothetical protein